MRFIIIIIFCQIDAVVPRLAKAGLGSSRSKMNRDGGLIYPFLGECFDVWVERKSYSLLDRSDL